MNLNSDISRSTFSLLYLVYSRLSACILDSLNIKTLCAYFLLKFSSFVACPQLKMSIKETHMAYSLGSAMAIFEINESSQMGLSYSLYTRAVKATSV